MRTVAKYCSFVLVLASTLCFTATTERLTKEDLVKFLTEYLSIKYRDRQMSEVLYVAVARQKMYHIKYGDLIGEYDISTAMRGLGNKAGSKKTPTGLHMIQEKVGIDVPAGGIFEKRVFTGEIFDPFDDQQQREDLITSRILHLKGLEQNVNQGEGIDSYKRCIYIHGTHQEDLIGTPASHGCIRMRNLEVIELFDNVGVGTYVVILNN